MKTFEKIIEDAGEKLPFAAGVRVGSALFFPMLREFFATTHDGETVERFTMMNKNGLLARFISWGAGLVELQAPDREGTLADVTLGFDTPEPWLGVHPYFGVIAGRYANRIARGKFSLDGKVFTLATNNGANHLHGGNAGFDKRNWRAEILSENAVRFSLTSADGDEGYPGTLEVAVIYTLTDDNELRLDYEATTDQPTVLNLTNHTYWNLGSAPDILAHELTLHASRFTAVDAASIPTGELPAARGAMDFTKAKAIGRDIAALKDEAGGGYDHNWVLDGCEDGKMTCAAELHDPASGRVMTVFTTEPGIQFYSGNYLDGLVGSAGRIYGKHSGLCLETQHFPDSPNHPNFPMTILRPGEKFRSTTVYRFSVA